MDQPIDLPSLESLGGRSRRGFMEARELATHTTPLKRAEEPTCRHIEPAIPER